MLGQFTVIFREFAKGYCHKCASKQKHEKEVCSSPPERSLFQHSAVSVCEDHIEQEVKTYCSKK